MKYFLYKEERMYMVNGLHELAKGKVQDLYRQADAQRTMESAGKSRAGYRRTGLLVTLAALLPGLSRKHA